MLRQPAAAVVPRDLNGSLKKLIAANSTTVLARERGEEKPLKGMQDGKNKQTKQRLLQLLQRSVLLYSYVSGVFGESFTINSITFSFKVVRFFPHLYHLFFAIIEGERKRIYHSLSLSSTVYISSNITWTSPCYLIPFCTRTTTNKRIIKTKQKLRRRQQTLT